MCVEAWPPECVETTGQRANRSAPKLGVIQKWHVARCMWNAAQVESSTAWAAGLAVLQVAAGHWCGCLAAAACLLALPATGAVSCNTVGTRGS